MMLKKIIGMVSVGWLMMSPLYAAQVEPVEASNEINFTVPKLEGDGHVSLKDYRGKVVLVDLWASWCGPCLKSFPLYNALYNELKDKGFEILAINMDPDLADAKEYLKLHPVNYTILVDPQGEVGRQIKATGMPFAVLIGRDGKIVSKHPSFYEDDFNTSVAPQIRALVAAGK